jgi:ribosome-associated protein
MKTSHEKIGEGKAKTKARRASPRATGRPSMSTSRVAKDAPTPSRDALAPSAGGTRDKASAKRGRAVRDPAPPSAERSTWGSVASEAARETASAIAIAALDKKAIGVEILDVAGRVDYADFLVIMTGRSDRHAQALAQGIEEALKRKGVRPIAVEGLPHGSWVLMDFGDVVVHVFQDEARQQYDIEGLWLDARRLPVPVTAPADV